MATLPSPLTSPSTSVFLTAAGVSLVLDLSDGRLPSVLHWGAALPAPTDADALALVEAAAPVAAPERGGRPAAGRPAPRALDGLDRPAGAERVAGRRGLVAAVPGDRRGPRRHARWPSRAGTTSAGAATLTVRAADPAADLALVLTVQLTPEGLVRLRARLTNTAADAYALAGPRAGAAGARGGPGGARPRRPLGQGARPAARPARRRHPPAGGAPGPDRPGRGHAAARRDARLRLRPRRGLGGAHRLERQPHPLRRAPRQRRAGGRRRRAAAAGRGRARRRRVVRDAVGLRLVRRAGSTRWRDASTGSCARGRSTPGRTGR